MFPALSTPATSASLSAYAPAGRDGASGVTFRGALLQLGSSSQPAAPASGAALFRMSLANTVSPVGA